jgi:hypothetical protein
MAHQGNGLSIGIPLISNSQNSQLSNNNQNTMRNIQLNNMATSILTELAQQQLAVLPLQRQFVGFICHE